MRILIVGILVVVALSVFIIKQSGYNPKPILVMKPSVYDTVKSVGYSLLRRFFKESETSPYIYVVCKDQTCSSLLLWKGFLEASEKNKLKPREIYVSKGLEAQRAIFDKVHMIDVGTPIKNEGAIVFLKEEDVDLIQTPDKQNLVFYMTNFYLRREKEPKQDVTCGEVTAFKDLRCLALFYSRDFYKKKLNVEKSYVGMNRISANKYVLYFNK